MSDKTVVALATHFFDNPPDILEDLHREFEVVRIGTEAAMPAGLPVAIEQLRALVTSSHEGVPEWIWGCPELKVIGNFGVGYDGIDTERAARQGIWVTNTPDVLRDAVAELAMGMLLSLLRKLNHAERFARDREWESQGEFQLTEDLCGKRLGMLGMGGIGSEIAARAAAFKMEIAYTSRNPKEVPWKHEPSLLDLASWSDILCCIVPASSDTNDLVNKEVLDALGPDGYLLNIGRGNVVDEETLIACLQERSIAGAALDVYKTEPAFDQRLSTLDNVLLLPHVGSATKGTRRKMAYLVLENVHAALAGKEPPTPVNDPK